METKITWFTAMANRLRFLLEALSFMTPYNALTEDQLRNINDHGSKKRNR